MLLQSTPSLSPHSVLPSATPQASSWHSCVWTMPTPAALTWPSRRLAPQCCSMVSPAVLFSTSHSPAHHSTVSPFRSRTLLHSLTTCQVSKKPMAVWLSSVAACLSTRTTSYWVRSALVEGLLTRISRSHKRVWAG
jgi:hypothetical protein